MDEIISLLGKYRLPNRSISKDAMRHFDLMNAVKRRECGSFDGGGVMTPEMFEKWIIGQLSKFNRSSEGDSS